MIICDVNKNDLDVRARELLTAGSMNVNTVTFRFSADWERLTKTVTFKTSKKTISVLMDEGEDDVVIPWEVLADADEIIAVGVFGVLGETIVLPSVWGIIGKVIKAADLGDAEKEPTPGIYQKILDELNSIEAPKWANVAEKPFETVGDGLKVGADRSLSVGEVISNAEILRYLVETDTILTVTEDDGSLIADEDGNVLMW